MIYYNKNKMATLNLQKTAPVIFTRPANATPYAIGQVMNGTGTSPLSFEINTSGGGNIWIVGGQASTSIATNAPNINLMLFSGLPTVAADGGVFSPTDAEMQQNYLGTISFNSFATLGQNGFSDGATLSGKPIIGVPNGTIIYGVAVANGAYTPSSGEQFTFRFDYQLAST